MQQLGVKPGDYDALHAVPNPVRDTAMATIMTGLAERRTKKIRLIDGHYINTVWGEIHVVTADWSWIGLLDAFVLIEATPAVVWQRISEDENLRDRELFTKHTSDTAKQAQLATYLQASHDQFDQLTSAYQKDHFVLTHNDNDIDRTAQKLIHFVDSL